MRKLVFASLSIVFALALVIAPSSPVNASQSYDNNCVVNDVTFADETWGRTLFIQCTSGNYYYAFLSGGGTPSGCQVTPSIEYVKMWNALAAAAYMSGRKAAVAYDTVTNCGSGSKKVIRAFELRP